MYFTETLYLRHKAFPPNGSFFSLVGSRDGGSCGHCTAPTDLFSQHSSTGPGRKSAGDWLDPNWTRLTNYPLVGSLHVNSSTQQLCIWERGPWKTLEPVYMRPHCRRREQQRSECQCLKGGVKGEAEGKLSCLLLCLEKLCGNIMVIIGRLKWCSVDLQRDKSYFASRVGQPSLSDMLMNTEQKNCQNIFLFPPVFLVDLRLSNYAYFSEIVWHKDFIRFKKKTRLFTYLQESSIIFLSNRIQQTGICGWMGSATMHSTAVDHLDIRWPSYILVFFCFFFCFKIFIFSNNCFNYLSLFEFGCVFYCTALF